MLDAAVHTACYHMQCKHYDPIKPPSYFEYRELNRFNLTRQRERFRYDDDSHDEQDNDDSNFDAAISRRVQHRALPKSIEEVRNPQAATARILQAQRQRQRQRRNRHRKNHSHHHRTRQSTTNGGGGRRWRDDDDDGEEDGDNISVKNTMHGTHEFDPNALEGSVRLDGNLGAMFDDGIKKATYWDPANPDRNDPCGFAGVQGGRTPHLFLQELAHLTSLCAAVGLATLRNDIEGAESPLDIYEPGSEWPTVDPYGDFASDDFGFTMYQRIKFFLGNARTPEERTKYNARRPLPVIGGVSDGEIRFLQQARGPWAKSELCWYWVSELISREHLSGCQGAIGPPIISRTMQFLGDANVQLTNARKIIFIPFPFPHAQLSVVYVLVMIPAVALLFEQYVETLWLAAVGSFLTVCCLAGIHEVGMYA
eukprot:scaffold45569_cov221-Amphora_coffeaeformis.AAC.2